MFKTSQQNIPQIKAALKAYPQNGIWFHGCGNMYADQASSDFRQKFTNPNSEDATYRIHFTNVKEVPATVEELNKMLMASRSQEIVREKMPKVSQSVKTISVEEEVSPLKAEATLGKSAEDLEYERLLAEEEKAQKGK
jgi:hypothetical protein